MRVVIRLTAPLRSISFNYATADAANNDLE